MFLHVRSAADAQQQKMFVFLSSLASDGTHERYNTTFSYKSNNIVIQKRDGKDQARRGEERKYLMIQDTVPQSKRARARSPRHIIVD